MQVQGYPGGHLESFPHLELLSPSLTTAGGGINWERGKLFPILISLQEPLDLADPKLVQAIWKPEVFFPNAKEGDFQFVTMPNLLIRIHPDGEILYILRYAFSHILSQSDGFFSATNQKYLFSSCYYLHQDPSHSIHSIH